MSGLEFFTYMLGMIAGWILCSMFYEPKCPEPKPLAPITCHDGSTRCALGVHHD